MTSADTQIVDLYETHKLSVEDVAREMSFPVEVIRSTLAVHSKTFAKQVAARKEEDISDEEYKVLLQIHKGLAMGSEDVPKNVQERALRYLMDNKKGRLDKTSHVANANKGSTTVNVLAINGMVKLAQKRVKDSTTEQPIEMEVVSANEEKK